MNAEKRSRLAIVHPHLTPGGGSEAKALWLAEALKAEHEVHLITMGSVDLVALNAAYGTSLRPGEVEVISIPYAPLIRDRFDAWKGFPLARYCLRRASRYDLMISAYNVMDFGRRGIQFIADVSFADDLRRELAGRTGGYRDVLRRASPFRTLYLAAARFLAGSSADGWKLNLTVANSDWMRRLMKDRFGLECPVIHPPISGTFPVRDWVGRKDGFVCLGRISPEKRIHEVIHILAEVRRSNPGVHLHIVGRTDDAAYERRLRSMCRERRDWCFLEGSLFGIDKEALLARHRYGISSCRHEAFGMATAEMVKAGCLVWVPTTGGQVEIVSEEMLQFSDGAEAVAKIRRVLAEEHLQKDLRGRLAEGASRFSVSRFTAATKALVRGFLATERSDA